MTIQQMEHVGVVVDDLAAATAFFVESGLELQGSGRPRVVRWTAWWGSRASGVEACDGGDSERPRTA